MNRVLLLFFVVLFFLYTTSLEADRFVTKTVHNRLKFALNRGAHDASLQIDRTRLADGSIVFERTEARSAFLSGLQYNLLLLPSGAPRAGSLLTASPELVFEDYVDDATVTEGFPLSYVREDRHIVQVLKGPAVIYQVRVKLPRTHNDSYDGYVYKTVIYEYPYDEG
jgi:hypothetical protein